MSRRIVAAYRARPHVVFSTYATAWAVAAAVVPPSPARAPTSSLAVFVALTVVPIAFHWVQVATSPEPSDPTVRTSLRRVGAFAWIAGPMTTAVAVLEWVRHAAG